MTNIYVRQMQELGLNPKQYAELIEIPYGVVKDFIYGREGDYEMGLKDLLRRNMLEKHQEIEENFEGAKIKAAEIKHNEGVDLRKWYENEYTPELLLNTLGLRSRVDFERKYDIILDGKRASHWFYVCLTGKTNYDNHEIRLDIQDQFIRQLYDILVNNNAEKYKREEPTEVKIFPSQRKPKKNNEYKNMYFKWFREFDIRRFIKEQDITQSQLAKEINVGLRTIGDLVNERHYTKRTLQKLYNYVNKVQPNGSEIVDINDWYNNFDFKQYLFDKNLRQQDVFPLVGLDRSTFNQIVNHVCKCSSPSSMEKIKRVYDYIVNGKVYEEIKEETQMLVDDSPTNDEETKDEEIKTTIEEGHKWIPQYSERVDYSLNENTERDLLRKILVSRLTEEEVELITLFGGKIN